MSFRARLTLAVALAVAVAVAAASAITYALVRNELRGQVDDALRERVSNIELGLGRNRVTGAPQLHIPPDRFGGAAGISQLITADGDVLRFADIELDPATREVHRGDDPIELTRTEFTLLELFLLNPRQVLTRSIIFERVWGYDFGFGSNSLDVYIGYLRRKTEQGGKPRLIQTIRGVGYALREP